MWASFSYLDYFFTLLAAQSAEFIMNCTGHLRDRCGRGHLVHDWDSSSVIVSVKSVGEQVMKRNEEQQTLSWFSFIFLEQNNSPSAQIRHGDAELSKVAIKTQKEKNYNKSFKRQIFTKTKENMVRTATEPLEHKTSRLSCRLLMSIIQKVKRTT